MHSFEMQTMQNFTKSVQEILARGGNIVCFGASSEGKRALQKDLKNVTISCFYDNDVKKWGSLFLGVPICSPEELKNKNDTMVIITSIFVNEITKQLKSYGIDNIWYSMLISYRHSMYDCRIINENRHKIVQVADILADRQSVDVFETIIKHRQTQNLDLLCDICDKYEYFRKDIFKFTDDEVFIDVGAYTGDTIYRFKQTVEDKYHRIYAFEPDAANFLQLEENFKDHDNIMILKKGLYDTNGVIGFAPDGNIFSKIDNSLDDKIEVCRLKDVIEERVTFIKMDIEGAELKALEGSKEILLRDKPKLAICVYHKPADIWEIPLYIHNILPEHKIYLRHHSLFLDDTVLYATL